MELLTKSAKISVKIILVALEPKNYTGALQENRFLLEWSFFSPFFWDFTPKVLNKSLVMFDMCFAKFFSCKQASVSCEGYSGNCLATVC